MSTILTTGIIQNSTQAVDSYVSTAKNLNTQLEQVINTLTTTNFIGEASDGYKAFFTSKIVPALTTGLIEGDSSLMGALKNMMTEIGTQFMTNADPALGEANANAGNNVDAGN